VDVGDVNLGNEPGEGPNPASVQKRRWEEWLRGEIVREEMWRAMQLDWRGFQEYEIGLFKESLAKAARTYTYVTRMSVTLFVAGLGLFACAAIYPLVGSGPPIYSAVFGGLGTATFVTMFIFRPFDKAQTALSDLLQAEICFMSAFELTQQWSRFAASDPQKENLALSTTEIKVVTKNALELLQHYLEPHVATNGEAV